MSKTPMRMVPDTATYRYVFVGASEIQIRVLVGINLVRTEETDVPCSLP